MDGAKKIKDYVKDLLKNKKYSYANEETRKGWAFGAIDFSLSAKLIDADTYNAILEEFDLI